MKNIKTYGFRFVTSIVFSVLMVVAPFQHITAAIDSCTVNVSPESVQPNSQTLYNFSITNDGPDNIVWIQINRPSSNFTFNSAAWAGSSSVGEDQATLYDGLSIAPNDSATVGLSVHAGESQTSGEQWNVLVSENSDGSNRTTCSGSLDASVAGARIPDPDTTPPVLGAVVLSQLRSTSITVQWTTNDPSDSDVSYGETSEYGLNKHDTTLTLNHSMVLDNLSPDTSYHFTVTSYDPSGNGASATDGTFLTPVSDPPGTGSGGTDIPISNIKTTIPLKAVPTEKIPPTIELTTNITAPQKIALLLTGKAEDNDALAGIYYSLDSGKNWLPVDTASGLGTKKATFSFKPQNLQDGSYGLMLRAIDTSSNQATTSVQTLVIDRLPPTVGGNVVSVGSQPLIPDANNVINSLVGVDQKITLSAVGGPTSIMIVTTEVGKDKVLQSFNLTQSADNGLWSGILSYAHSGIFQLAATSVDGAGNHTLRPLNIVNVSEAGKVTDKAGAFIKANITVYTLDTDSNSWVLWDGESYDQPNPVIVSNKGKYGLYLPTGNYYFKISAPGFQDVITSSFTLNDATAVNDNYKLHSKPGFKLGSIRLSVPWPVFSSSTVGSSTHAITSQKNEIIGSSLPQFVLMQTNGVELSTVQLFGKPTIITFINTWSDSASSQLESMSHITEPNINLVTVASGESLARLSVFAKIAGYHQPIVADSDNVLIQKMHAASVPTTYFVDTHGLVKKVMLGVLSKEELIQNVSH